MSFCLGCKTERSFIFAYDGPIFSSTIWCKDYLFPIELPWCFCQNQLTMCVSPFLDSLFCFIDLYVQTQI